MTSEVPRQFAPDDEGRVMPPSRPNQLAAEARTLSRSLLEMIPSLRQSFASIVEACDTYDRLVCEIATAQWSLPKAKNRLQDRRTTLEERRRSLAALSLNPRPQAGTLLEWWADDAPEAGHLAHFALVARLEWERRFQPGPGNSSFPEADVPEPTR